MTRLDEHLSYSLPEAAEVSGHSLETVRAAIRSGDLRAREVEVNGRKLRRRHVMREDLLEWLRGAR